MKKAREIFQHQVFSFDLVPVSLRELFFINQAPCDFFSISEDGTYEVALRRHAYVAGPVIKELIQAKVRKLYVHADERKELAIKQQENLRLATRSLSMGDPVENAKKQINLLLLNMRYLYENPTDDDHLNLMIQSVRNLARFLLKNQEYSEQLYQEVQKQKHHFVFAQPFFSSFFLLGVLKTTFMYSDREMEHFFVTSFFKDIGMSVIPPEKYDKEDLSSEEKILFAKHPQFSSQILKGRIQLAPNFFNIIENHHQFGALKREVGGEIHEKTDEYARGFELMIVSVMDIIAAMIAGRPFRPSVPLFEALELVRALMLEEFPKEFRLVVAYFKNFFKN